MRGMSELFVGVLPSDTSFHGDKPLTYKSSQPLQPGNLVMVPLKNKRVLGLVSSVGNTKPAFPVKNVTEVLAYPPIPPASLHLIDWLKWYYPAPLGVVTQLFAPFKPPKKHVSTASAPAPEPKLPPLTPDQARAIKQVSSSGLHILHGETGTGKTRVYTELVRRNLQNGKSAIILTPEIGLTSQLTREFRVCFGDKVALMHSGLTDTQRQKVWFEVLQAKEPIVVIGPRSALFAPVKSIGLIVIDESHETAYKQDRAPYYHASYVAAELANASKATLVLGSATPSVSDYLVAKARRRPIIRMTAAATKTADSKVSAQIVDLKDRSNFTRSAFLSDTLLEQIKSALARREQVLLFLNRRGTARIVLCEKCGWQATCGACDLPMVYHGDLHMLVCHTCGRRMSSPASCPECSSASVVFRSAGTKAIADHVAKLFPDTKIQRFDTDNKARERLEEHLEALHRGDVDIIIGTQTLAKGLDLPRLSLVGVILADSSLYFPDFSAQERTYQLLHQVLGRADRGHRQAHAIVQTFAPSNPIIKAAIAKDWSRFYKREAEERQNYGFPPFCYLLKLTCRRASAASAERAGKNLAAKLQSTSLAIAIEGPAPAFHEKLNGKYQWQLIIKSKKRSELLKVIDTLPANWSYDIDPLSLL